MIKPIETVYNGYRFRSRLEARWAVFFDTLGIEYQYELEGFELGDGVKYLPDFRIARIGGDWRFYNFVEIKPIRATDEEFKKAYALADNLGTNVFIFQGNPYPNEYEITYIQFDDLGRMDSPIIQSGVRFGYVREEYYVDDCTNTCVVGHFDGIGLVQKYQSVGVVFSVKLFRRNADDLMSAYTAARQARFEHGERPGA